MSPDVKTVMIDEKRNIRYEVYAYRTLSRKELVFAIRYSLRKKKHKKNSTYQIVTIIGHDE